MTADDTLVPPLPNLYAGDELGARHLLAMMGLELRTPLNAIGGYLQLFEMGIYGALTAEQREALMHIDRSQRHVLRLVNDMMDLVRLEMGHLEYAITAVPIAEIVSDLQTMIEPQMRTRAIAFRVRDCGDCVVLADRAKLVQVLLNLLSNAVKFTPIGGEIRLDCPTRRDGTYRQRSAFIRVSDTGGGIPRDMQDAVFEPFVQVDTSSDGRAAGAGLGLTISRNLARGMKGTLRVRSEPGRGSSFTLTLPVCAPAVVMQAPATAFSGPRPEWTPHPGQHSRGPAGATAAAARPREAAGLPRCPG